MKSDIQIKKEQLECLKREIELAEEKSREEQERKREKDLGLYIPLATAVIKNNLWFRGERDFEELGDAEWYTARGLLGEPDLKAGLQVSLIKTDDGYVWCETPKDGDFHEMDDYLVLVDSVDVRTESLKDIVLKNK